MLTFQGHATALDAPLTPTQDPGAIITVVEQFLHDQSGAYGGQLQAHVESPRTDRLAPCSDMQAFAPAGQRLRSRMSIQVRCLAPQSWNTHVQANLTLLGFHYVATRTIHPGETVTLDDMHGIEADLLRLPAGVATDPSQIVGRFATQRIRSGAAIKTGTLRDPESIQRGQRVRTEARGPGFVISGEGQALQGGPPGSTIQVRAISGQVISGIVVDASTVQVPM